MVLAIVGLLRQVSLLSDESNAAGSDCNGQFASANGLRSGSRLQTYLASDTGPHGRRNLGLTLREQLIGSWQLSSHYDWNRIRNDSD
jgi:hypothetical protein